MVLPLQARIDYHRLCEVEHNVRCKDVGLVDVNSMNELLGSLKPCRIGDRERGAGMKEERMEGIERC